MTKKIILIVSIIVNVLLGIALLLNTVGAIQELKFQYVEEETITPDSMRKYLEWENYGVVAAHPWRCRDKRRIYGLLQARRICGSSVFKRGI